ncbi:MAG: leucyl aminopeptidase [Pseudomonadota bacterium]|nr:leucyl aminopeptidase [Pseudomonadota bacterium]
MRIKFSKADLSTDQPLVLMISDGGKLLSSAQTLDKKTNQLISRVVKNEDFDGTLGQILVLNAPNGIKSSKIALVGVGDPKKFRAGSAQLLGGKIYSHLVSQKSVYVAVDSMPGSKLSAMECSAQLAFGAYLRSYRFDKYRTRERKKDQPKLKNLIIGVNEATEARKVYSSLSKVANGVFFTRDLVSEPANILFPESFVERARELTKLGIKLQVLGEREMRKLGMGALLGVAQGSHRTPRLIAMRWDGAPNSSNKRPIAFIGKGVTFDSGGISIKPSGGMEDMKWDMGGAGVVAGLMRVLAERKAKVNAVGVAGLVENMPSGTAQRPGDVVKTMSGQTIEVINTDAEGRLVLADAMWWCQQKFKPHTMIDLATLTGAIIISLGHHHAGMFANDDDLANKLAKSGDETGERVWRMPLGDDYDNQVKSQIADMKNVGGRDAGSITAAQILQRFVQDGVKWAHLDIAGVTWSKADSPTVPKGGTGFGVRLLDRLVADHYEN